MSSSVRLEKAVALVLELPLEERLQLIERVTSAIVADGVVQQPEQGQEASHWGQSLVHLIQSLDMSEWETMDMEDKTEWVRSVRQQDEDRLKPYWNGEK